MSWKNSVFVVHYVEPAFGRSVFATVNHCLHDVHWNDTLPEGRRAITQKTTAATKKSGASIHPMTGIQIMQPPMRKEMKPLSPGPISRVFELPHFGHGTQSAVFVRVGAAAPQ